MFFTAAVDRDEDGVREENNKHTTEVEKVDTETFLGGNSESVGRRELIPTFLESSARAEVIHIP